MRDDEEMPPHPNVNCGSKTRAGKPCPRTDLWPDGKCWVHTESDRTIRPKVERNITTCGAEKLSGGPCTLLGHYADGHCLHHSDAADAAARRQEVELDRVIAKLAERSTFWDRVSEKSAARVVRQSEVEMLPYRHLVCLRLAAEECSALRSTTHTP